MERLSHPANAYLHELTHYVLDREIRRAGTYLSFSFFCYLSFAWFFRCGPESYRSQKPNPHILEGALVGGPNKNDEYKDHRGNYKSNEVALDYNSCFQVSHHRIG